MIPNRSSGAFHPNSVIVGYEPIGWSISISWHGTYAKSQLSRGPPDGLTIGNLADYRPRADSADRVSPSSFNLHDWGACASSPVLKCARRSGGTYGRRSWKAAGHVRSFSPVSLDRIALSCREAGDAPVTKFLCRSRSCRPIAKPDNRCVSHFSPSEIRSKRACHHPEESRGQKSSCPRY